MKNIKSTKKSIFKKIFVKICRVLGYEIIDQSDFSVPTSNKFLKTNAIIHIASDSKPYISEILSCVYELKNNYLWLNQNKAYWDYANLKLPNTKYFQKALKNGLNPFYLKLIKL